MKKLLVLSLLAAMTFVLAACETFGGDNGGGRADIDGTYFATVTETACPQTCPEDNQAIGLSVVINSSSSSVKATFSIAGTPVTLTGTRDGDSVDFIYSGSVPNSTMFVSSGEITGTFSASGNGIHFFGMGTTTVTGGNWYVQDGTYEALIEMQRY